jgi:hypothetical protein
MTKKPVVIDKLIFSGKGDITGKHVAVSGMYALGWPDKGPEVKKIDCLHGLARPSSYSPASPMDKGLVAMRYYSLQHTQRNARATK